MRLYTGRLSALRCRPAEFAQPERKALPPICIQSGLPIFEIIEVPKNAEESIEQLGTKYKFWFHHPTLGRCLCKLGRPNTGEDWSEKVAAELAALIGLPHARYELGTFDGQNCVVSPKFVPSTCTLIHGNELLGETNSSYGIKNVSRYRQTAHTLEAVEDALVKTACELPLHWDPIGKLSVPIEVFTGYLLLDAWIGNTDRHHENWAIIENPEASARRHLAPTFDHASSLGCHLRDEDRRNRLGTTDAGFTVEAYADRARSALYRNDSSPRPMKTMETFELAAEMWPKAARVWLDRLSAVREGQMGIVLEYVPSSRISQAAADFARRLLLHNRGRLMAHQSFQ